MTSAIAFRIVMIFNALWFSAGFLYFSVTPNAAAKLLIPKTARSSPLFATMVAALRFLGGFNLAFGVFAVLILLNSAMFPEFKQQAMFAAVFSLAHGTQFGFNLPAAFNGGRQGESLWTVLSGSMLFIFVVDATLMFANAGIVIALLRQSSG